MAIEQLEKTRLQFLDESRQGLSARQQNEGRYSNEVRQWEVAACGKSIWGNRRTAAAQKNTKENAISENSTNEIIAVSELPQPAPKQLPKTPNKKSLREVRRDLYNRARSNRPKKISTNRGYTPKMCGKPISPSKASIDRIADSRRRDLLKRGKSLQRAATTPKVRPVKRNIHSSPCRQRSRKHFPDPGNVLSQKPPIHRPSFTPKRVSTAFNAPTHRFPKQLAQRENPRNHPPWIHPGNGKSGQDLAADILSKRSEDERENPSDSWPTRSKYDIPSWPCNRFAKTRDPQQLKMARRIFPALSPVSDNKKRSRAATHKTKIMCPADFVRLSFPALQS